MAKDLAAKRRQRISRSETRRLTKLKGKTKGGDIGDTGTRQNQNGERVSNAVRRTRSPSQGSQEDQQSSRYSSRYPLRVRKSKNDGPKVREAAGWDSFEGKRTTPAEEILVKKRRCGYNRFRLVESTLPGAGYGLFMKAHIVKAGGLLTTYERLRLTKAQMEQSESDYIYEVPMRDGSILWMPRKWAAATDDI